MLASLAYSARPVSWVRVWSWVTRRSPRSILVGALAVFWVYSWPGFVGWDTRSHFVESRTGHISDGHPPAIAWLVKITELFVTGPAGLLLIQSITLIVGLYLLLAHRVTQRAAAWWAAALFLFPPIAGVTALIAKDSLMAGFLMIGIACLLDERPHRHRLAIVFIALASLMRWNALAATFAPMILLYRFRPSLIGVRRYAVAAVAWLAVTAVTYEVNDLLAVEHEHIWYWSNAYEDIAGTLEYMPKIDDATAEQLLDGVPLRVHDHIQTRFRAVYTAANFYHLMRGPDRLFEVPSTDAERDAIYDAWQRVVLGNPAAYLRYRWDGFRLLVKLDRPVTITNVYIWFTVVNAPETIPELGHDAWSSWMQAHMIGASIWLSLTPLYFTFIYLALCFVLLAVCWRQPLELALLLSAIGYEAAWFVLAVTTDVRYSQWMELATLVAAVLAGARLVARRALRGRG
jgi:hypothetical protein